jgi:NAD(P)-dependent dehydrogenase (short-subunit alcohol dehydrogenase family)
VSWESNVAIVTGSGRALGLAYAQELARQGAAVVINDVDRAIADAAVASIVGAGGKAVAIVAAVGTADTAAAIVAGAVNAFGHLVVNWAGLI